MSTAIAEDLRNYSKICKISCIQLFVSGPMNSRITVPFKEHQSVKQALDDFDCMSVIHGSYIDNAWTLGSVKNVQMELDIAASIGSVGVIIHLSKITMDKLHILNQIKTNKILFLEINPMKMSEHSFESPEKICKLFNEVRKLKLGYRVGLCVDTAHLASIGVLLSSYEEAKRWFSKLPNVPLIIHLNDSKSVPGSGIDRHEVLERGQIWNKISTGIDFILEFAKEHDVMLVVERDNPADDLKIIAGRLMSVEASK